MHLHRDATTMFFTCARRPKRKTHLQLHSQRAKALANAQLYRSFSRYVFYYFCRAVCIWPTEMCLHCSLRVVHRRHDTCGRGAEHASQHISGMRVWKSVACVKECVCVCVQFMLCVVFAEWFAYMCEHTHTHTITLNAIYVRAPHSARTYSGSAWRKAITFYTICSYVHIAWLRRMWTSWKRLSRPNELGSPTFYTSHRKIYMHSHTFICT